MLRRPLSIDCSEQPWAAATVVTTALHTAGYQGVFVGGCVRDHLLGRPVKDADIATNASPDQVQQIFPQAIGVGAQFGVMVVPVDGTNVEVATFRSDHAYIDGRRPTGIEPADEATDTARRDFTINALIYDPQAGELRDHVGGLADLDANILRVVGDPRARLQEDRLRVLRALRFAAHCHLTIEPASAEALRAIAPEHLSRERIWDEWDKALGGPNRSDWWSLVGDFGHRRAWSELVTADDCPALDHLPADPVLGQALLLAAADAKKVNDWLKKEPISRERRQLLSHVVTWSDAERVAVLDQPARRRLLAEPQAQHLVAVWQATQQAVTKDLIAQRAVLAGRERSPLLSGADLKNFGIAPGPAMGDLLRDLVDAQLAGEILDRPSAEAWVRTRSTI